MPALTRRRDRTQPVGCRQIFYGDVKVSTIAQAVGRPNAAPEWTRDCGFYPGSNPGECTGGSAESFDAARAAFERAWPVFLSHRG